MEDDVQKPVLHLAVQSKSGVRPEGLDPDGRICVISGLSVGRGEDNDLVLPDLKRTISKHHCVISHIETGLVLVDHSRNGTFLNRQAERLQKDTPVPLAEGDVIRVGEFSLTVLQENVEEPDVSEDIPEEASEQTFLGAVPMKQPVLGFASTSEKSLQADDAGDLFSDRQERMFAKSDLPAVADHLDRGRDAFVQPVTSSAPIPDDWDLMGELGQADELSPGKDSDPMPDDAMPDAPMAEPSDRKDVWAWPADDDGASAEEAVPNGPDKWNGTRPTNIADWDANPTPPTTSRMPAHEPGAIEDRSLSAFLSSAGLERSEISQGRDIETMALAGAMLREAITALHGLLKAQAEIQIRIGSMGASQNTNPIMLFETPEEALRVLLRPDLPGFMTGDTALKQAGSQIGAFQENLSTVMQDALRSALQDLSPDALCPDQKGSGVFSNGYRRLWGTYARTYTRIKDDLETDLEQRFGPGVASKIAGPGKKDGRHNG